jgi:3-oxoacyl-[acyl-carrier-protein] synthase-3
LALITGIEQRRIWPAGMLPSDKSIESCELALESSGLDRGQIGALVHGSVCRDHLEPATACRVHHALGLRPDCLIHDVSNACLGLLSGMMQVANMIELGQIRAGLVVGTEDSRHLLETTIAALNSDVTLTRSQIKLAVASLTIGSGSCAVLLVDRELSETGNALVGGTYRAHTAYHTLCQSGRDEAVAAGMQPLMATDSEALMREGIALGATTFESFLAEIGWARSDLNRVFCHQVGAAHRKLMLEAMGIELELDFATFPWLGNTGSVALPMTLALGLQGGVVQPNAKIAMLGIGSGINCLMLGAQWHQSRVGGELPGEMDANGRNGSPRGGWRGA